MERKKVAEKAKMAAAKVKKAVIVTALKAKAHPKVSAAVVVGVALLGLGL